MIDWCGIICGFIGLGIWFLLFVRNSSSFEHEDIYYGRLYCSKCGKCSEQLLLCGHENAYEYTCPYCGNVMRW